MDIRELNDEVDAPYMLRFPVRLGPGTYIKAISAEPYESEKDGTTIAITQDDGELLFTVRPLGSMAEGAIWIRRLWRGLQLATIRCGMAFRADLRLQTTWIADGWRTNPGQLRHPFGIEVDSGRDASVDGSRPYLLPEGATAWKLGANAASVTVGKNREKFLAAFEEGLGSVGVDDQPTQLETAIGLFGSAELEQQSPRARLLTYVMAIEALAQPQRRRHAAAVEILERFQQELKDVLSDRSLEEDARADIEALRNELHYRTSASMRATVFRCINELSAAAGLSKEDVKQRREAFDLIYGVRGALSHTGQAADKEVSEAVRMGRELCESLLDDAFKYGLPAVEV